MPRGDGTGPWGQGPITGRGLGYCTGYDTPGYAKAPGMGLRRGLRSGFGLGYGRGAGWRRGTGRRFSGYWGYGVTNVVPLPIYSPPITPETQLNMLKQEKQFLESDIEGIKSAIDDISKRIEELEKTE
ncbi:MAG: DUF5320 domain-containing protein [Candidatus Hodarchaeota archaeon]